MGKSGSRPRGKMSAYAFFVQTCREEYKKLHPGEQVVFADFSRKCAMSWKTMDNNERTRFDEMAERDKIRFENDIKSYELAGGSKLARRKKTKDPSAPKRALSAFFFFCNEERPRVRETFPGHLVGDIAKELGRRWEACVDRTRYQEMAVQDKLRYEQAMNAYRLRVNLMMSVAVASTAAAAASLSAHQTIIDGEVSMQQHRGKEPDAFSDAFSCDGNDVTGDGDL